MSHTRMLKVFCSGAARDRLARDYPIVETYDAFALVEVDDRAANELARAYPTEDITDQYIIHAGHGAIDTSRPRVTASGRVRSHPAYRGIKSVDEGPHHYLVQFIGPIKNNWLRKVEAVGGQLRRLLSDFTYIVRCDQRALEKVASLPFVRWTGHYAHRDRLLSSVDPEASALPRSKFLPSTHKVEFFGAEDLERGVNEMRELGAQIITKSPAAGTATIQVIGTAAQQTAMLKKISAVHGVAEIRNRSVNRPSNDVATGIMQASGEWLEPLRLDAAGEIIGICDTGLDSGKLATIHPDFAKRIKALKSYVISPAYDPFVRNPGDDDGPADLDSGHGTHVAGSAPGSGAASVELVDQPTPIRGLAHRAKLVFQAVEQECDWKQAKDELEFGRFVLAGIPDDLTELFAYAYSKGVRIHSNSWGGGDAGDYDDQCRQLDEFVWKKKDFCVLVAAGNDGTDHDGDGKINLSSVTPPATAKNCITVGATESLRPEFDHERYGTWWPDDYPKPPLKKDPMANDAQQVAAFSSRGPTRDGRIKPDVVAPGTFILSTRSRKIAANNTAWSAFPPSKLYFYMGGTSMATPLVAGAAAIVRQFLRTEVGYKSPSAALIKAALVLGAQRLPSRGRAGENGRHASDNDQGYGLVHLKPIVAPEAPVRVTFVDQRQGLSTGELEEIPIVVHSKGVPLRVVLVYADYPGRWLVNNLNLFLESPDGKLWVGNGPDVQGPAARRRATGPSLTPDTRNNVELIQVLEPRAGTWTVRIIGSNVPQGPQDWALALCGDAS